MSDIEAEHDLACSIVCEADVLRMRQLLREHSSAFRTVEQTKLITAASELARNILKYAGPAGGHMQVELLNKAGTDGLRVVFTDEGPGIADVEQALEDGFSTGGSLGLGLPGARRLVDEFSIESAVGRGTTISFVKWNR